MPNEIIDTSFEESQDIQATTLIRQFSFERLVALKVAEIRDKFKRAIDQGIEGCSDLTVEIVASGPVLRDQIKIEFKVGARYSNTGQVTSHSLEEALKEWFRRKGFDDKNSGLLLTQYNETARS